MPEGEKIVDMAAWPRRGAYELFSREDYPFYAVTISVDVTRVKEVSKARGISFYYTMIWLCTKAVNSVPEFRLRVRDGRLVELGETTPNITTLAPGSENFQISSVPWLPDLEEFCAETARRVSEQRCFLHEEDENDGQIYFTCTPWFDFVSLSNPHSFDRDDTIPRLAWGKYFEDKGRLWVHMSIEVNHRTIDGYHIARLKEAIEREIGMLGQAREGAGE